MAYRCKSPVLKENWLDKINNYINNPVLKTLQIN